MKKLLALILPLLIVGCATITSDPNVPVAISFSDGSKGTCRLTNKRISIMVNIPSTPMVRRSDDNLLYSCTTSDGRSDVGSIVSSIDAAKFGASVLFIDLCITDAITDKSRNYPSSFVIPIYKASEEQAIKLERE